MSVTEQSIAETLGRKLDELQARFEPRAYEQTVELLQLVSELYGAGLSRMLELADLHAPDLVAAILADDLLSSLLVANGLHPDTLEARVERALDAVRPFLAGHGGDVELLDIDDEVGAVHLRLLGSCDGCPSSAVTLRSTVERAIRDAAPEVAIIEVEQADQDLTEDAGGAAIMLIPKPAHR